MTHKTIFVWLFFLSVQINKRFVSTESFCDIFPFVGSRLFPPIYTDKAILVNLHPFWPVCSTFSNIRVSTQQSGVSTCQHHSWSRILDIVRRSQKWLQHFKQRAREVSVCNNFSTIRHNEHDNNSKIAVIGDGIQCWTGMRLSLYVWSTFFDEKVSRFQFFVCYSNVIICHGAEVFPWSLKHWRVVRIQKDLFQLDFTSKGQPTLVNKRL